MPIIQPTATLKEAVIAWSRRLPWQKTLLVCECQSENKRKLVGVLSEKEFLQYLSSQDGQTVMDFVNRDFEYLTPDAIEAGIQNTKHYEIPVVDDEGNYMYMITNNWRNTQDFEQSQGFEMGWWKDNYAKFMHEKYSLENYSDHFKVMFDTEQINSMHKLMLDAASNKCCMEIGAGPGLGIMPVLNLARRRIVIEPLAEKYHELRKEYGICIDGEADIEIVSKSAEEYMGEFTGVVDGLMVSNNTLDHSPEWYWVLSNMASYAAKGSLLLLSTDTNHHHPNPCGHYNITFAPDRLKRLVENLGYETLLYGAATQPLYNQEKTLATILARKL